MIDPLTADGPARALAIRRLVRLAAGEMRHQDDELNHVWGELAQELREENPAAVVWFVYFAGRVAASFAGQTAMAHVTEIGGSPDIAAGLLALESALSEYGFSFPGVPFRGELDD